MDTSVSTKDEIWFLRVCHHISNAVYRYSMCDNWEERISSLLRSGSLKTRELDVSVRGGAVCVVRCVVCGVRCVVCGVRCVVCGVWCAVCAVRCAVCVVRCVLCGVWCVVCGVWCAVCGVWCPVCGVRCVVSNSHTSSLHAFTSVLFLSQE